MPHSWLGLQPAPRSARRGRAGQVWLRGRTDGTSGGAASAARGRAAGTGPTLPPPWRAAPPQPRAAVHRAAWLLGHQAGQTAALPAGAPQGTPAPRSSLLCLLLLLLGFPRNRVPGEVTAAVALRERLSRQAGACPAPRSPTPAPGAFVPGRKAGGGCEHRLQHTQGTEPLGR